MEIMPQVVNKSCKILPKRLEMISILQALVRIKTKIFKASLVEEVQTFLRKTIHESKQYFHEADDCDGNWYLDVEFALLKTSLTIPSRDKKNNCSRIQIGLINFVCKFWKMVVAQLAVA